MKFGIRTIGLSTATLAATVAWFSGMVTVFDDTFVREPLVGVIFAASVLFSIPVGIVFTTLSFADDNEREHWPIATVSCVLILLLGFVGYYGAWPLAENFIPNTAFTSNRRFWWLIASEVEDAGFYLLCIGVLLVFGNLLIAAIRHFRGRDSQLSDSLTD
tara:strand:+ start:4279 stop:4758 length:480 start_codon:yes stop_codon:yes gene_type:complete